MSPLRASPSSIIRSRASGIDAAEEKFGVTIPDEEVKNLKTVGDAVAFIERAQG